MVDNTFDTKKQTLQEKVESEFMNKPSSPPPPQNQKGPLKSLRTFQGDMEEILKKTNGSVASVVIAEQKRKEVEKKQEIKKEEEKINNIPPKEPFTGHINVPIPKKVISPEEKEEIIKMSSGFDMGSLPQQKPTDNFVYDTTPEHKLTAEIKNKIMFSLGALLLLLGIITITSVYYIKSKDEKVIVAEEKSLVAFSKIKDVHIASTTRKDFISTVLSEKKNLNISVNSVLYLKTGDIEKFIETVTPQMPSNLSRSLSQKYMLGIYSYDTNEPFIILTGTDFGLSYSGMLQWEKTILLDIGEMFGVTQPKTNNYFFEDETIKNKDLRVVKDANRKTIFLYAFLDRNTILITTHEAIFSAILGKYNTSKASL